MPAAFARFTRKLGASDIIYSTGFFRCLGVVIYSSDLQTATLGHLAPATDATQAISGLVADFPGSSSSLDKTTSRAYIFGGCNDEADRSKSKLIQDEQAKHVKSIKVVTLAEMGVNNGFGIWFDRTSGAYGVIMDSIISGYDRFNMDLSLISSGRNSRNESNNTRSGSAKLLSATTL